MSEYCIYLKMPTYLRQWFIHHHGGKEPVHLLRGSCESLLLQRATVPLAPGAVPERQQEGEVAVCIPDSKIHDARKYNQITERGKKAMVAIIKSGFDLQLWNFLSDFGHIGSEKKELIYLFMEQHGIEEDGTSWDTIAKIYQRQRKIYLTNQAKKRKKCSD